MAKKETMEEDFLTCYICYDVFKEPKTLACLHRFCEKCLHSYIIGQKSSVVIRQGGFQCPICRELIKSPNPKRPPADWASLFKTDFYLNNLIRFMERKGGVSASPKKPDNPCKNHKENETDLFCVDCQQIICHLCAGISHRSCNQVVTVSEAAQDKRAATEIWLSKLNDIMSRGSSIDKVKEKSVNNLEKQKAKTEEKIKAWSEEVQLIIRKEEMSLLQNLNKQYQSMREKIGARLTRCEEGVSNIREKLKTISSNGRSLSDCDILKMTDISEVDIIEEGESNISMYKSFVDYIQRIEIVFEPSAKPELQLGSLLLRTYNEQTDTPFLSSKSLEISTNRHGKRVYDLNMTGSILYSKEPHSKSALLLKNSSPSSSRTSRFRETLSKVLPKMAVPQSICQNDRAAENSNSTVSDVVSGCGLQNETQTRSATDSQGSRISGISTSVRQVRSINSSFREDTNAPKLRDVLVAQPGPTILVTDWANQCVKAFFIRREKDSRIAVGGKPWAITRLGTTSVAVSLPLARQICILKITSPLMVQKSFMVAKNYSGLATLNSETLVASGGSDPPSVDIVNLFGEVLKSFSNDDQGHPLFIYPAYVNVSPSAEILVSDKKRGTVISLSHTGKVRYEFNPQGSKQLQEPCGIVSLPSGHVLLLEMRGLLKLTPRGELDQPLIRPQDGLVTNPKGVDVDRDGRIYVTTNEEEVAVFEIS